MDKKVSILTATWNKEDQLRNYLFGLHRQVLPTHFDFELCIIDDCSDIDPIPIINEFFPATWHKNKVKYKRLNKHSAFNKTQGLGLDLISDDTDIVVLIGADIILTREDDLQKLVEKVEDKKFALAEVVDIPIPNDFYTHFDSNIKILLDKWDHYIHRIDVPIDNKIYKDQLTIYSGKPYNSWLLFCGAIKKKDLLLTGFAENSCDAVVKHKMKEQGLSAILVSDVKAIHQRHPKKVYPCPDITTCEYHCIRKLK